MSWYNANYLYRKKITVDYTKIDADLTDFPLTVLLSSSNFDFTKARSDGYDVIFVKSDDLTPLKFERELYDDTGEKAVFHVKAPTISSLANTELYMYFGYASATDQEDAANVWDSSFELVCHMGSTLADSTSNGKTLTNNGTTLTTGPNGEPARSFNGTSDYISTNLDTSAEDDLTFAVFAQTDATDQQGDMMLWEGDSNGDGFGTEDERSLGMHYNADLLTLGSTNGGTPDIVQMSFSDTTSFHHFVGVLENLLSTTNMSVTYDTQTPSTATPGSASTTINFDTNMQIGRTGPSGTNYATRFFDGIISEVRISSIARSNAWTDAEYQSLSDQLNSFATIENRPLLNTTETIVKELVDELMVSATDTDRNISILEIVTNQERGTIQEDPVSDKDIRLDRLIESVLAIDDYGHKMSLDLVNKKIKYDIIVGEDLTDEVKFSNKVMNLDKATQQGSESNYRNVIYITGDGVSGEYGTATGLARREISVTDSKLTTTDELSDRADQELQGKYFKTESIQGTIRMVGNPLEYQEDYDLGDYVTVIFNGTTYEVQITEIEEVRNGDNRSIALTFGTPQRPLAKMIADMAS